MTTQQIKLLPTYRKTYKITIFLHPAEYVALMKQSVDLDTGKVSMHRFFKKAMGIENAREEAKKGQLSREIGQRLRRWGTVPSQLEQRRQAAAKKAPKRNSPRKLAA